MIARVMAQHTGVRQLVARLRVVLDLSAAHECHRRRRGIPHLHSTRALNRCVAVRVTAIVRHGIVARHEVVDVGRVRHRDGELACIVEGVRAHRAAVHVLAHAFRHSRHRALNIHNRTRGVLHRDGALGRDLVVAVQVAVYAGVVVSVHGHCEGARS